MKNSVQIGNLKLNTCVSLAPMAGITDYVLRSLVRKHSPTCLLTTEMISSEALIQESKRKKRPIGEVENELVRRGENHSPIAYQLTGHKPELMYEAAQILEKYADIIDINMGCPVNKVVKGNDGCALMRTPDLAAELVKSVKSAVKCPVSVKFRLGYTLDELNFVEFGQKMQEAGADFITIHGRTRSQMYSGEADWKKIKNLTKNVDIPVFANGDITSVESAIECLSITEAAGVAVGRAVLGDVTLLSRIEHFFNTGEILKKPLMEQRILILKELISEEIKFRGEDVAIKFVRKFYPYYVNGFTNAAKLRSELVLEPEYSKIMQKLEDIICDKSRLFVS